MKKLYRATEVHDVVFTSSATDQDDLIVNARHFISEQDRAYTPPVKVVEITNVDQLDGDWLNGSIIWGESDDITAPDYLSRLKKEDAEYQEYLRLKAKFAGVE